MNDIEQNMTFEEECRAIAETLCKLIAEEFSMPVAWRSRMERAVSRFHIQPIEDGVPLTYDLYMEEGGLFTQVEVDMRRQSHLLECPPVWMEGGWKRIEPVVCVVRYKDRRQIKSSLLHELTHYFSVGPWEKQANGKEERFIHDTGIGRTEYRCAGGMLMRMDKQYERLNEEVTDFIAAYLYGRVFGESYTAGGEYNTGSVCEKIKKLPEPLIRRLGRAYFENDREYFEKLLLPDDGDQAARRKKGEGEATVSVQEKD